MDRLSRSGLRHPLMGLVCALGLIGLTVSEARAASLTITVTESSGGGTETIADNSALDTNPAVGIINVNTDLLNGSLNNYTFAALGATSNAPGTALQANLTQTGQVLFRSGAAGSVTVLVSDIDYNLPTGLPGTLNSSASNTYTNAPNGNSQAFTSWFNPSNTLNGQETASPTVTLLAASPPNPNSHSGDAGPTSLGTLGSPYGLTNSSTFTLTGGTSSVPSQVQFTGSTTVTAIPEPASLALMLSAVPVTLFGALRRRKAAK